MIKILCLSFFKVTKRTHAHGFGTGFAANFETAVMSKFIFKTNINCIGCASQIKPHLDKLEQEGQINHWQVHLREPEHTLEIDTNRLAMEEVRSYVQNAGFKAEPKE